MRRSLAGLILGLAAIFASLAISGFWLQFTAFSPSRTPGATQNVLRDDTIRNEIARVIAEATAPTLGQNPAAIQKVVRAGAATREGSELLEGVVADAHSRLIGNSSKPVVITAEQMVPLVGNEVVATVADAIVDVPTVTAISTTRQVLKWLIPISGGLAVLLIALGFAAHPERAELLRSISFLLLGTALMLVIIGYIVPALILPLTTKSPWVGVLPKVASHSLPRLLLVLLILIVSGLGCLAASGATKRRDRWSSPVRTRYSEQRRWS